MHLDRNSFLHGDIRNINSVKNKTVLIELLGNNNNCNPFLLAQRDIKLKKQQNV